jgi:hypothetical protein
MGFGHGQNTRPAGAGPAGDSVAPACVVGGSAVLGMDKTLSSAAGHVAAESGNPGTPGGFVHIGHATPGGSESSPAPAPSDAPAPGPVEPASDYPFEELL